MEIECCGCNLHWASLVLLLFWIILPFCFSFLMTSAYLWWTNDWNVQFNICFLDMLGLFPPNSVQLKKPFAIRPWLDSEENVGNLLMVRLLSFHILFLVWDSDKTWILKRYTIFVFVFQILTSDCLRVNVFSLCMYA